MRSRRQSFEFNFKLSSSRYKKPQTLKDIKNLNLRYKYLYSENYRTLDKLMADCKRFWPSVDFLGLGGSLVGLLRLGLVRTFSSTS